MNTSELLDAIKEQKNTINISVRLKRQSQEFTQILFSTLFDQETNAGETLIILEDLFLVIRNLACPHIVGKPCKTWEDFKKAIPELFENLKKDAQAIFDYDPAAKSIEEVYLAYPGFYAIAIYRMARVFYLLNLPLIPRLMTEYAHQLTGIDIHPGATIGSSFFIDHGTGVVIGETTVIHDYVKLYQGVTLGALTVNKALRDKKRHPTVEDNVTIYANSTILGGNTVIGKNSVIGGNCWLTNSIAQNSRVMYAPQIPVNIQQKNPNE